MALPVFILCSALQGWAYVLEEKQGRKEFYDTYDLDRNGSLSEVEKTVEAQQILDLWADDNHRIFLPIVFGLIAGIWNLLCFGSFATVSLIHKKLNKAG